MPNRTIRRQAPKDKLTIYEGTFPDKPTNCYALLLFEEGYAEILVNHTKYHCTAPSVLCLNDNQSFKLKTADHLAGAAVFFYPDFLNSNLTLQTIAKHRPETLCAKYDFLMLLPFLADTFNDSFHSAMPGTIQKMHRLLQECSTLLLGGTDYGVFRARSRLIDCLHRCEEIFSTPQTDLPATLSNVPISKNSPELYRALRMIWDGYADPDLNAACILEALHVGKTLLNRQFQSSTGMTIYQYILNYRLNIAVQLMLGTDKTIDRISEECGFNSYVTFSIIFKKKFGISPQDFRSSKKTRGDAPKNVLKSCPAAGTPGSSAFKKRTSH